MFFKWFVCKKNKKKNHKKVLIPLFSFLMILCIVFIQIQPTYAYTKGSTETTNKVDSSGGTYFEIKGGPNGNSRIKLRFVRKSGATTWASFRDKPSTWTVSIVSGTNNHKIQLDSTTVTTKLDVDGNYFVLNIPVSYEMPAYYKYKDMIRDYPGLNARYNLGYYKQDSSGSSSAYDTGGAQSSTSRRKINLQLNTCYLGLKTYSKTWYYDCTIGFNIHRQQYNVKFLPNGGTGYMADQVWDYGFAQTLRKNTFTRTGHHFKFWKVYRDYDNKWAWADGHGNGDYWQSPEPFGSDIRNYNDQANCATTSPSGNVYMYAQWDPNMVQIAYNPNGGTVSASGYGYNQYGWITYNGNTYFDTINYGQSEDPYNASTFGLTKPGYTFKGWKISWNGQILNEDTIYGSTTYLDYADGRTTADKSLVTCYLYAQWEPTTYTNYISHWASGFNGEGNNSSKTYYSLATTSFTSSYGNTFIMDSSRKTTIPNGFQLRNRFGTSSISGSWTNYNFGTRVNQKAGGMSFEYDYDPITYNISYNLNGGTLSSGQTNPSSYNVLYGVTFKNPLREGYKFLGWYIDGQKVTGINPGANATFSSPTDMYNKLNSRTIGDKTVEARWQIDTCVLTFDPNGGTVNPTSKKVNCHKPYGELPVPTRKGYDFLGWFTAKDGGSQVTEETIMGTKDVTVYAHWKVIHPTLTVKKNYYFQNTTVTIKDIKKNASANDVVEGDISNKITIESITYPNGVKVDNPTSFSTSQLGNIKIVYKVENERGGTTVKEGTIKIIPLEDPDNIVINNDIPKIYSRFISNEILADGRNSKETLAQKSVWKSGAYKALLDSSLNKNRNDYLTEYDYVNSSRYVKSLR